MLHISDIKYHPSREWTQVLQNEKGSQDLEDKMRFFTQQIAKNFEFVAQCFHTKYDHKLVSIQAFFASESAFKKVKYCCPEILAKPQPFEKSLQKYISTSKFRLGLISEIEGIVFLVL